MEVEICVRVLQKAGADPDKNFAITTIGDVIEMLPVGSFWGTDIYAMHDYRILRIDEPVTTLDALMASEEGEFPTRESRKRIYQFDPLLIPQTIVDALTANPEGVTDLRTYNLTPMIVRKPDIS